MVRLAGSESDLDSQGRRRNDYAKARRSQIFMKTLITIIAISLVGQIADSRGENPEPKSEVKGEVLEFGLIEPVGAEQSVASPDSPFGKVIKAPGARFIKRTDQIVAVLGVTFGISFQITGMTENNIDNYMVVITHPPFKNAKGQIERQYVAVKSRPTQNLALTSIEGYRLNHAEELAPGVWTIDIWYHDKKVVSKSFDVANQKVRP